MSHDPFGGHGGNDPSATTYTNNSRINNQPDPSQLKPGPKQNWYVAGGNWSECEKEMAETKKQIKLKFDGSITIVTKNVEDNKDDHDRTRQDMGDTRPQANAIQKAAHQLYLESNGKLGKKWEPEVKQVEVANLFEDHWFPGRNSSWYRGFGAEAVEDYAQPASWQRLWNSNQGDPYQREDADAGQIRPTPLKIYSGALEDFYLVQACYAISMKGQLLRNLFDNMKHSDPKLGMFIMRFYKHAQWICVPIDDYMPHDKHGNPMCITSESFPSHAWPALVEKAYAKLHGSWSAISGGGSVEDVMTDLTGGCSGSFHTGDVAGDRMWKYFDELKATTVWGVGINEHECSKRLIPIANHWASAIYDTVMFQGVPYVGVFTCAPQMSVKHFPMCELPMAATQVPHGYNDGFMWLRMDDFIQLFDIVYECRLVNSDLRSLATGTQTVVPRQFPGGQWQETQEPSIYERYTPSWQMDRNPWYEQTWAYRGEVVTENCPSFLIEVKEPGVELIMDIGTTDMRYNRHLETPETSRHMQAPLLLRFFQCARDLEFRNTREVGKQHTNDKELVGHQNGEIYMAHMSAWAHTRDAMCCVKVLRPGNFVAMVSMPSKFTCQKMIFRSFFNKPGVTISYLNTKRQLMAVNPGMPLCAIPYSLTGMPRIDDVSERLPRMFDEDEGKGKAMAGWQKIAQKDIAKALGYGGGGRNEMGSGKKVVGHFGGANADASTLAAEGKNEECSVM